VILNHQRSHKCLQEDNHDGHRQIISCIWLTNLKEGYKENAWGIFEEVSQCNFSDSLILFLIRIVFLVQTNLITNQRVYMVVV
jgi:hypothetical protein